MLIVLFLFYEYCDKMNSRKLILTINFGILTNTVHIIRSYWKFKMLRG